MSIIPPFKSDKYDDGRTMQSFKDDTDINKLLSRAQVAGGLSHIEKYAGMYGDFENFDFLEAQNRLARGREIFDELPSEIRREFGNKPGEFFKYVANAESIDALKKVFPQLARPGTQRLSAAPNTPPQTRSVAQQATTEPPQEAPSTPPAEG